MIGAIAGDMIGSIYEQRPIKIKDFELFGPHCRFTDDTVLTVAVAHAILTGRSYRQALMEIGRRYPHAGYGGSFIHWLGSQDPQPYGSWGNGSAMRVSPVGFAFDSEDEVILEARKSAQVSHDHPEGIKGAQAMALTVFWARTGRSRKEIRSLVAGRFGYDLDRTIDEIRPGYGFDVSCQGTVPEAIIAFLESSSYEDAVRNAVSLGGDSDTLACICGGIAEAYYKGIPQHIEAKVRQLLPSDLAQIMDDFRTAYIPWIDQRA
jgi:ADP-ribosylglycohydrolase